MNLAPWPDIIARWNQNHCCFWYICFCLLVPYHIVSSLSTLYLIFILPFISNLRWLVCYSAEKLGFYLELEKNATLPFILQLSLCTGIGCLTYQCTTMSNVLPIDFFRNDKFLNAPGSPGTNWPSQFPFHSKPCLWPFSSLQCNRKVDIQK